MRPAAITGRRLLTAPGWWCGVLLLVVPASWAAHHGLDIRLMPAGAFGWVWALILSPALEETVYRRLLQDAVALRLTSRMPPDAPAAAYLPNLVAGFGFVIVHSATHGVFALWWLIPALVIGETYRRWQSLPAAILLHSWMNLCLAAWTLQ